MPAYNLGELSSFLTQNVGRRADVEASTASRLVNEAYFEVAATVNPQERERIAVSSTTTGENKIELPTDFLEPISASIVYMPSWSTSSSQHSSFNTLEFISHAELDATNPQPSGTPKKISFFNSWAELLPSPNSAYSFQLRYISHVTDLVETGDVPSLSTPWRPAVLMKAEEKLNAFLGDFAGEAAAQNRYLRFVSQLKSDTARRQAGQFRFHAAPSWGVGGRRRV